MKHCFVKRSIVLGLLTAMVAAGCSSDGKGSSSNSTTVTTAAASSSVADTAATTASSAVDTTTAGSASTDSTAATDSTATGGATLPQPPDGAAQGGTLKLAIDGEAACYLPSACSISYGPGSIRDAVLQHLVRAAANSGGFEAELADSITPNSDFTEFTLALKPDITYSDGSPFVAGDVKTLFDTYVFGEKSTLKGNVSMITATAAPDDHTVVFTLSAPTAPFPALLTNVPIWKPEAGMTQTSIPIGTGPFILQSWEPNVKTTLVRNPHFWEKDAAGTQLPYLDEIDVTPITSGDTRVNSIQSGEVDLTMSTDPLVTAQFGDVATVNQLALNAGGGLFFNNASPPTDDVRVRQALAYATNKTDILQAIGGGEVRDEYYTKQSPWYSKAASAATPSYDPEKAKALLAEYVNDPTRSDGKPAGTALTIDIAHVQGAITQESIAALAQQEWGDIGVTVTVTPKDQSTLIGDAIAGNFNVNYFGWATPHPYSLLTHNYTHWPENPSNYTHFNSDELASIIADMSVAKTSDEIDALVIKANDVFAAQVPLIFLHSTTIGWASNDTVTNINLLPATGIIDWPTLALAS